MANQLTATLHSNGTYRNVALPGGIVSFAFSDSSTTATDVVVEVFQAQEEAVGTPNVRRIAMFRGSVSQGGFQGTLAEGYPINTAPSPTPLTPIKISDGSNVVDTNINDWTNHQLFHLLRLKVSGKINGTTKTFESRADFRVEYPQVMIVPTPTARALPSGPGAVRTTVHELPLNIISAWSRHWQLHDPDYRIRLEVPTIQTRRPIRTNHYQGLLSKIQEAVDRAPGGIIALAIGHSDGGDGGTDAWSSLVPEDVVEMIDADGSASFPDAALYIHQAGLTQGYASGSTPGSDDKVRLDCLDRMADIFTKANPPIRKLILHSCKAGMNRTFMRMMADRIKVPVQAHLETLIYQGRANRGPIHSFYHNRHRPDDEHVVSESEEHEWPTSQLGDVFVPNVDLTGAHTDANGHFPRRHGVPDDRR